MLELFSDFECPPQDDVKNFLQRSAIRFQKEDKSRTYLILDEETSALLGYFAVTFKEITYPIDAVSKSANKKAGAIEDVEGGIVRVRAYLIGQLGKNKAIEQNPLNLQLILEEIYGVINAARSLVGGRAIILECADDEKLISLYESCHFKRIEMEPNHNGDVTMYTIIKG